jgi:uncharacterized protein with von Willebrand factor type A (vWA) domain
MSCVFCLSSLKFLSLKRSTFTFTFPYSDRKHHYARPNSAVMSHHHKEGGHICGLYYNSPFNGWRLHKNYIPQVELKAHATILSITSRTVLTQTFINPSNDKGIKECRYTFPLYDGVSVVSFTCYVGNRTIMGEVKAKERAGAVFEEAVARGETAGLMEQLPDASDVFTTTVGNVPPGAKVVIKINYLGELKHDMEVDGIRFTIPNIICPRYGSYPEALRIHPCATDATSASISITVDVEMPDKSTIKKIQSPTHPIAMTMGTTSLAPDAGPAMNKASATLSLGTAQLETDFVFQIIAKDTGVPKAILENHPSIPNHRALMVTLVPKFALPSEKPEIVFVCDRSGSMGGTRISLATQALKVFLKSLPIGVKFNICSFGSHHSFLWPRSVTYSQQTLDEAMRHADTFSADFGGTEMLPPLRATIEQRYKDMSLEVMMLTDGETWNQQALFMYLNESTTESKAPIRVFTLGIGNGVSHALIESVAKAGNGFSQTVGEDEKMDSKVVRMLKGALSPHINDYTLEVKYGNSAFPPSNDDDDENFEIVEKVADSLKVKLDLSGKPVDQEMTVGFHPNMISTLFANTTQKPFPLFDSSVNPDAEGPTSNDTTGEALHAHLPSIAVPKIIQAPQAIPSLFAFSRSTVYLLLSPSAPRATPTSVILRGTNIHGPLELEIPIQILDQPGETVHQLAAKKAISELEQGKGWLAEARDEVGELLKEKVEGRFEDMAEREAVRLGVQFKVGGMWCSFVAVEKQQENRSEEDVEMEEGWEWLEDQAMQQQQTPLVSDPQRHHQQIAQQQMIQQHMIQQHMIQQQRAQQQAAQQQASQSAMSAQRTGGFPGSGQRFTGRFPPALQQQQQHSDATYRIPQDHPYGRKVYLNTLSFSPAPQAQRATLAMSLPQYQMSLMNLEQNNKNRLVMQHRLAEMSQPYSSMANPTSSASQNMFDQQDYSNKLMLLEQQRKKRMMMARQQQDHISKRREQQLPSITLPPEQPVEGGGGGEEVTLDRWISEAISKQSGGLKFSGKAVLEGSESDGGEVGSVSGVNPEPDALSSPPGRDEGVLENFDFHTFLQAGEDVMEDDREVTPEINPTSNMNFRMADGAPRLRRVSGLNAGSAEEQSGHSLSEELVIGEKRGLDLSGMRSYRQRMQPPSSHPDFSATGTSGLGTSFHDGGEAERLLEGEERIEGPLSGEELLHHLIGLQSFEGSWSPTPSLFTVLNVNTWLFDAEIAGVGGFGVNQMVLATALVVVVFEERLKEWEGAWELVVEKARCWLESEISNKGGTRLQEVSERARSVAGL